jgi:hypothetical protein
MGVVDVTSFPYTVTSGTYYMILGMMPAADSCGLTIKNSAGVEVVQLGFFEATNSTAYPYGYQYGYGYPVILVPGDVLSASNVSAVRLLEISEPNPGQFLV